MGAKAKTFTTTLTHDGALCAISLPFDPKIEFGKLRAPVKVTINGYTYRSTIAAMGGPPIIPLRKSHRDAAGLTGDETVSVRVEFDRDDRSVAAPPDLARALKASPPAWDRWQELSYTHQREHVEAIEDAKKPDTRARRIERAVAAVRERPARKRD